jgi:hypothetical protein
MAELKTKLNDASVADFINSVPDEQTRQDCWKIIEIMKSATNAEPKMWGASIVGFGQYRYKYASGREGDWMLTGFSPRKQNISLYLMGHNKEHEALVLNLGKISRGKGCIYVKRLSEIKIDVLETLIRACVETMRRKEPTASR